MKSIVSIFILLCLCIPGFAQQTVYGSILHDDLEREYILYIPETYNPGISAPLVFNFHGYGSSAAEQMWYGDFRSIADTAGILVVHPMGTDDDSGSPHWNVGGGGSTVDDVGFTEALIDSLASEYNINSDRIFCTGMSNGGFMSYKLACELSNRIAGIASVTGSMRFSQMFSCDPQHPMPIMEIHGTADIVVPYDGTLWTESIVDVLRYWTGFNNCDTIPLITNIPDYDPDDGCTVEHYLFANGDNGVEVEHFKVIDGGHTWPGCLFGGNGNINYDIDASVEIWKFFSKYDINGMINPTGIYSLNFREFNIYPNPAWSFIIIESESGEQFHYQLSNSIGKLILSGFAHSKNHKLDISALPQGIYFLKLGNRTYKIIKTE